MTQHYGLIDTDGDSVQVDQSKRALKSIEAEHSEIHEGNSFFAYDSTTNLGAETDDTISLLIDVPAGVFPHLLIHAYGSGEIRFRFWEGAFSGGGAGGSAVTPVNRNRNSANTSDLTITKDTSPATGGTLLMEHFIGAGFNTEGSKRGQEWILKPSTSYYVEVYDTSNINAYLDLNWYE